MIDKSVKIYKIKMNLCDDMTKEIMKYMDVSTWMHTRLSSKRYNRLINLQDEKKRLMEKYVELHKQIPEPIHLMEKTDGIMQMEKIVRQMEEISRRMQIIDAIRKMKDVDV